MSIIVHHLNLSRSFRVLWLLHELELDFSIQRWQRDASFRAPTEAQQIHPLGRFPLVEVDGLVLAESGAILEYFADREGRLRPREPAALVDYRFFLHYAEGSAMPPLLVQLITRGIESAPLPFFIKPIASRIARGVDDKYTHEALAVHFGFVESTLAERPYFAGDTFTCADIQMIYPVEACLERVKGDFPHMQRWRELMRSRPAFERAHAEGGPAVSPSPL